jgi:glutathione-regulated potassium-efflux system ancillary protein KefC
MDVIWIGVAFGAGMVARALRVPTMVGYLLAGLVLSVVGVPDNSELIVAIGDLGVTLLLLFTWVCTCVSRASFSPRSWA